MVTVFHLAKIEFLWKMKPQWGITSIRVACGEFSWLMIDSGELSPLWVAPGNSGYYKKQGEQAMGASQYASSRHGLSVPASSFLTWILALTFFSDGLWPVSCKIK